MNYLYIFEIWYHKSSFISNIFTFIYALIFAVARLFYGIVLIAAMCYNFY